MDKFIELTRFWYKNDIPIDAMREEITVSINVSHIVYFRPEGNNCMIFCDDTGSIYRDKGSLAAYQTQIAVKESYDEVKRKISECK